MRLPVLTKGCLAAWIALACLGGGAARGADAWENLSGDALWNQAGTYEQRHLWQLTEAALTKYLEESPPAERAAEARYRLIRACHAIACWTKDFTRFYTLLAEFERDYPSAADRIQSLKQLWAQVPVALADGAEAGRRSQWYLAAYPDAPEALLVKRDLAEKKWLDGNRDGAILDLQALVSASSGNPNIAAVIGTLAGHIRERDGRKASADFLEKALADTPDLPDSPPLHYQLGDDYLVLERYAELEPHMRHVLEHELYGGQAHEAVQALARAQERAGRPAQGLAVLEDAIQRFHTMPHFHPVVHERAAFQLKYADPGQAIGSLKALIAAHPDLPSAGDAVQLLGKLMTKFKGHAETSAELERLAATYPGIQPGRFALSLLPELQLQDGDPAAALAALRRYVQAYPGTGEAEILGNKECYYLYRTGALDEAEKAAGARIQASKTGSKLNLIPAYVLSYTLRLKARALERENKAEEAAKALAYGREVFDLYLGLTDDEHMVATLSLHAAWGEHGKAAEAAAGYLAARGESTEADWVRLYLATCQMLQFAADPADRASAAKAAKTLDDLRAGQRARSDKVLDDVLNYTPLLWPRALDQRIMLASKLGDMDAVRECLLELRDKVPASAERDRSLGRNQALAKYHGVILSDSE